MVSAVIAQKYKVSSIVEAVRFTVSTGPPM
jgi:hypothetical protein